MKGSLINAFWSRPRQTLELSLARGVGRGPQKSEMMMKDSASSAFLMTFRQNRSRQRRRGRRREESKLEFNFVGGDGDDGEEAGEQARSARGLTWESAMQQVPAVGILLGKT